MDTPRDAFGDALKDAPKDKLQELSGEKKKRGGEGETGADRVGTDGPLCPPALTTPMSAQTSTLTRAPPASPGRPT